MGRPRATAAASRTKRGKASLNPSPKPKTSFLSSLAAPARTRACRRVVSSPASSTPGTSSSPSDAGLGFLSSPGSSASPNPKPRPRTCRAKPGARSPLVTTPSAAATPPPAASPAPATEAATASTVGELRSAVTSQVEALKRRLDELHSRAHADLDASLSRVAKRVKTQNQACQQLTDEVDKEYKKMSDNIKESSEKVKAKYKQIFAEVQSSTTRVCKVTIPEMTKTVEKAIDGLRSRYNISMPT